MSTYGTAEATVRTWVAGQEIRNALASGLSNVVQGSLPDLIRSNEIANLLESAVDRGLITRQEAGNVHVEVNHILRDAVARAAVASLADLGFRTEVADGPVTSIWAERGHEVMAVEIHEGGGYAADVAGIDGVGCQDVLAGFTSGMHARGVESDMRVHAHMDPRGGQLVRRVARSTRGARAGEADRPVTRASRLRQ